MDYSIHACTPFFAREVGLPPDTLVVITFQRAESASGSKTEASEAAKDTCLERVSSDCADQFSSSDSPGECKRNWKIACGSITWTQLVVFW